MNTRADDLLERLRQLEAEFEREVEKGRAEFRYRLRDGRVEFEAGVKAEHRRLRTGLLRFLRRSPVGNLVVAPFIYGLVVPLLLLDLGVWIYQLVCFPAWGLARVARRDYMVIDRHQLAYLNGIQKLNCVYCGYANGLIGHVREVASRTEQYWCPIKHAQRIEAPHARYHGFIDYGDAEGFRSRLERLRQELRQPDRTGKSRT